LRLWAEMKIQVLLIAEFMESVPVYAT